MSADVLLGLVAVALAVLRLGSDQAQEDSQRDDDGEDGYSGPRGWPEYTLYEAQGVPYTWGGGRAADSWPEGSPGSLSDVPGYDCSGYVGAALRQLGVELDWGPALDSVAMFWQEASEIVSDEAPEPGAVVFYGDGGTPTHAMIAGVDGRVWGAVGGGSATDGSDPDALITVRDWAYRSDFMGWVPFESWRLR